MTKIEMVRKFCSLLCSGLLVILLNTAFAKAEMILQAFPLAEIVEQHDNEIPEYRFVTGKISSIGSLVRTEQEFIVAGQLLKKTYEIPRVHSTQEVTQHYQRQLQNLQAKTLFYCEGRDCGRSNNWANEIFKERILFGPDRFQHYIAATFTRDDRQYAAVVYTIRRGNQRVYAHVEQIELASALDVDQQASGILVVTEKDLTTLGLLKPRLESWLASEGEDDSAAVTIVSYSKRSDKTTAQNLEHAASLARALEAFIYRELLPEDSVRVINVGQFAQPSRFANDDSFMELFVE